MRNRSLIVASRRVLVTDANTTKALAIVRGLGPTLEVWTASNSRIGLATWSRYVTKHLCYGFDSPGDLPRWLLETCKKYHINVVICPEEQSSFLVSREKDRFVAEGIVLTAPPVDALKRVMDKALTIEAAQEVGIPVPQTKVLKNMEEAIPAARELGYPIVIKPRFSHFWDGCRFLSTNGISYANSDDELMQAVRTAPGEMPLPLLQKFIPGYGCGISFLLARDGSVCAEFAHERLRDLRPTGSGSVLRRSVAIDPQLLDWSLVLLRHLQWSSVAMVEFRKDSRDGRFYLMEINGRFWGSLQLAIDAGVNFPELLVNVALGQPVTKPTYAEGVVLRWWLGDFIRALRVLKGRPLGFTGDFPSRLSGLLSFLGPQPLRTRNEVFRWNDPWPALGEFVFLLRSIVR